MEKKNQWDAVEVKREVMENTELAKSCESAVLILGETGTGKSTLARTIHDQGLRAKGVFISVNLASLHEETIESTLFGHERGAFTGAEKNRIGRLEQADGGTVFLDEIGELSLPLQARLLEFLQTKTFTPLGSNRERKVNVRVICATHRDLASDVRAGKFREDLFHRIRVLTLELPALSSISGTEFSEVIHAELSRMSEKVGRKVLRLSNEVAELFECYSWPGNFRELENVLEISVLRGRGPDFLLQDLPKWFIDQARSEASYLLESEVLIRQGRKGNGILASAEVPIERSYMKTMSKFERAVLVYAISRHDGQLAGAAREIGLSKATFYRKAVYYGVVPKKRASLTHRSEA